MNNTNFLARYDAVYWRLRRQAERHGLIRLAHYKGAYKANLNLYGKRPGTIKLER
jgi:hypothetical protein